MDQQKIAALTAQFLGRVQLQGNEVMAYVTCMQWLESLAQAGMPGPVAEPPPAEPPAEPPKKPARARSGRKPAQKG